jgi:hypothetical protein
MNDQIQSSGCVKLCPLPNTHNRLQQAHRLWHQMLDNYNDPAGFRANLNSTIEALRNVTFMLQKEKHAIPGFDTWYEEWQEKMKTDAIMAWLCEARTTVVHKSDLKTLSTAHATIHSNLTLAHISMKLPPQLPTPAACALIARTLPEPFVKNISDLVLSLERRWVAVQLPEWELLDALGHAYGLLSELVKEAHDRAGFGFEVRSIHGDGCTIPSDGRLPCMITTVEARTVRIRLSDGQPLISTGSDFVPRPQDLKKAKKRYELAKFNVPWKKGDPFEIAESLLSLAKKMLQKDKYHARIIFLRTPQGWTMQQIDARDRVEKYTLMRVLANEVHALQADALIEISEMWMAPLEELNDGHPPAEAQGRKEALAVIVATSDGKCREYLTPFTRTLLGKINLAKTEIAETTPYSLAPVFQVWGLAIPKVPDRGEG